ncbi:putative protein phosphatase 2C 24 [Apostasia shenzhenica]|uniref:protein-serine/threonine phosphatase n=1 Tax=Apostasia shenzhenica TaxID=1088818 RepID=A0A2H9ZZ88_9ASPA|nr:putative protein phosphatase 2C 24 [Apostasia shenzhenica]
MMGECYAVPSGAESSVPTAVTVACDTSSQGSTRRAREIGGLKFVAGDVLAEEKHKFQRKRKKLDLAVAKQDLCITSVDGAEEASDNVIRASSFDCTAESSNNKARTPEQPSAISAQCSSSLSEQLPAVSARCPSYGLMSVCGRRRDMEDAVSVHPNLFQRSRQIPAGYHFFGVFDGHGCSHVAVSCREQMHDIMAAELDLLDAEPSTSLEWKGLMERSFSRMDFEAAAWRGGPEIPACRCEFQMPKCDHVGSTAVVALVSDDRIIVANCGDSRAVLCRKGSPLPLSSDHKPDRPDELRRIEDAGGRVIYWDGARVLGVLAMSRAIGDNYLKTFVISEPEVTVTERKGEDECLILASDGLWDVVTNEMACEIVRTCLRDSGPSGCGGGKARGPGGSDKACADAAKLLTKMAIARQSADNVTVVVVNLRRSS